MRKFLSLSALLCSFLASAQDSIPRPNTLELFQDIAQSNKLGNYAQSLELLRSIHPNDSLACDIKVTESYLLSAQGKNDSVIAVIEALGDAACVDVLPSLIINKGVAQLNLGQYDSALETLERGLEIAPVNQLLHYNRGVALTELERYNEAARAFITTIYINPDFSKSFVQLGKLCEATGLIGQALLCYQTALWLAPDDPNALNTLQRAEALAKVTEKVERTGLGMAGKDAEAFRELDLLLSHRIGLNSDYQIGGALDISLVRQSHIVMTQANQVKAGDALWSKVLLPMMQWIRECDDFEIASYALGYSIRNEQLLPVIQERAPAIQEFTQRFKTELAERLSKVKGTWDGKEQQITYYRNGHLSAMGVMENEEPVGYWEFYDPMGRKKIQGSFKSGERHGPWLFFHTNGKVAEDVHYDEGKFEGHFKYYDRYGTLEQEKNFRQDELHGVYKRYNAEGALIEKKEFEHGKLDGTYESYFPIGDIQPEYRIEYASDIPLSLIEYYSDGSIYREQGWKEGKLHGEQQYYYGNGKPSMRYTYQQDLLEGPFVKLSPSGEVEEEGQHVAGENEGVFKKYWPGGSLKELHEFKEGIAQGTGKYYDQDGKLHYEFDYGNGKINGYRFFNKKGNVHHQDRKKGGEFHYQAFSPRGNLITDGIFDVKGGQIGAWKYYNEYGILTDLSHYDSAELQGVSKTFHTNGEVATATMYDKGIREGYFKSYYLGGNLQQHGWYADDVPHGEWREYYPDGTPSSITYFHKGKSHGLQQYFAVDGAPLRHEYYEYDLLTQVDYLDAEGNTYESFSHPDMHRTEKRVLHYPSGEVSQELSLRYGVLHGPSLRYGLDGTVIERANYRNGQLDGLTQRYYPDGKLAAELPFKLGRIHGSLKSYYENGELERERVLELDVAQGMSRLYHQNGVLEKTTNYKNDQPHGEEVFYGPGGEVQLIRFYEFGMLTGYTYLDDKQERLPIIPLHNATGVIKAFYANKNPSRIMSYEAGQFQGDYLEYYENGALMRSMVFQDGEYHGEVKEFSEEGVLLKLERFEYGVQQGATEFYHSNGKLKEIIPYRNGQRHGVGGRYDSHGRLVEELIYRQDHWENSKKV